MAKRNRLLMTVFVFLTAQLALGQAGATDLTGIVSDNTGYVLPKARVTVMETEMRVSTSTSLAQAKFTSLRGSHTTHVGIPDVNIKRLTVQQLAIPSSNASRRSIWPQGNF